MKSSTTAKRLRQIMDERGMRQVDIVEAAEPFCQKYNVKLGRTDLSQYASGKVEPGAEKLTMLSLALNVSETWLMGYDVPANRSVNPVSEEEQSFLELIRLLSPSEKKLIMNVIKGVLSER